MPMMIFMVNRHSLNLPSQTTRFLKLRTTKHYHMCRARHKRDYTTLSIPYLVSTDGAPEGQGSVNSADISSSSVY
ncbi:hypothetical protein BPOR_0840g00040 [Botrytis porri]|uniref:Uncharacterized protein n=1 Tax=Botrytis porri TaxID=87229 RepID=A0A4Z1K8S2_9HELO|nr:hypothetical protein BPOR_0840g00040 [Botrytis porri]